MAPPMIRGGSKRLGLRIKHAADLAGKIADVYRTAGMENNFTLWNTVADRHAEAAQGALARRKGARMDGGVKRKGLYKGANMHPILKRAVEQAVVEKALFSRPKPSPAPRNSLGQAKPKNVKAYRLGNIRVLVGPGKDGKTKLNWGTVRKRIAAISQSSR